MKPDYNDIPDLRKAFRPVPESFKECIRESLAKIADEKPAPHRSFPVRMILIAVLIIVSMSSAAYALTQIRWQDFFDDYGVHMTTMTEQALLNSQPRQFDVGPLTFTLQEYFSDGRLLLGATVVRAKDPDAVFLSDFVGKVPEEKSNNAPVYTVRALLQVDPLYHGEHGDMEEAMVDRDGHIVYFNMQFVREEAQLKQIPVVYLMFAYQVDPQTGDVINQWKHEVNLEIPVTVLTGARTYVPEQAFIVNGLALQNVRASLTAAGAYLCATFIAPESISPDTLDVPRLIWYDENNTPHSDGINLSLFINHQAWPVVTCEYLISLDVLPDELTVSTGSHSVKLR